MVVTAEHLGHADPPGMSPWQILQFFVLMPLVLGVFLGMARIGSQEFTDVGFHISYTCVFFVLSWSCYGIGAKLTSWALRPWKPSLLFVLLAGNFVGGFFLWWPLRDLVNAGFAPFLAPGSHFPRFWPPEHWGSYSVFTIQGILWWLLANWMDLRYRQVPRFGFAPPPDPAPELQKAEVPVLAPLAMAGEGFMDSNAIASLSPPLPATVSDSTPARGAEVTTPRLQSRLPAPLREGRIHALEAEEHYTKIHTSKGSTLLLIRFSDAIAEMVPQAGLQVHRSFWVSRHAVDRLVRIDRRWIVRLTDGMEIPVSRSYRVPVQSAGLAGGAAMTDD